MHWMRRPHSNGLLIGLVVHLFLSIIIYFVDYKFIIATAWRLSHSAGLVKSYMRVELQFSAQIVFVLIEQIGIVLLNSWAAHYSSVGDPLSSRSQLLGISFYCIPPFVRFLCTIISPTFPGGFSCLSFSVHADWYVRRLIYFYFLRCGGSITFEIRNRQRNILRVVYVRDSSKGRLRSSSLVGDIVCLMRISTYTMILYCFGVLWLGFIAWSNIIWLKQCFKCRNKPRSFVCLMRWSNLVTLIIVAVLQDAFVSKVREYILRYCR